MGYQYNDPFGYDPEADPDHGWVYVGYNTPERPPILNQDNFSSSETGAPVNDPHITARDQGLSMNMSNHHLVQHTPASYPSSSDGSIRAPDEPEKKPLLRGFLPVAPATGLGEIRHRRRASFDDREDQVNNSVSIWAKDLPPNERHSHAEREGPVQGGFLPLGTRIVAMTDSVRATRGKSSGSVSVILSSGSGGASSGSRSSNMDPTVQMGSWIGDSVCGGWPMYLDEEAIEEDGD